MPRYPFQPDILDALPEELTELFRSLELKLLKEICSRLKIAGNLNEVTVQDIRALRSHGIEIDEIKRAIAETEEIGMDKLNDLLDDVVERNQAYYKEMVGLSEVTEPQMLVDQEDIWEIYEQTHGELRNITQSMGFMVRQGRHMVMLDPAKAYQWALDSAVLQVQSGAISYNQAIRNAARELADSGLRTVNYESGHHDQLDVAVRRAVMTGVNQLNQKYREQSMEYLETDLVEVTAHLGARNIDGPNGWENHAKWQGKVYRWRAKPRTSTGNYKDFEKTCGYGDVQGIGGANCRHSFWPYIEGVSERTYAGKELEAMKPENRPKIVFEDKEYDDYQATQLQRKIEREIRKQKRRKAAFEAAGLDDDAAAANTRIRRLNAKYREFSKAAGLPEQRERMMVYHPKVGTKTVANTTERGILNSVGNEELPVTETAIGHVPYIRPNGWSEEQALNLQEAHRKLLRYVKDDAVGTEAAAVLDMGGNIISMVKGSLGRVSLPKELSEHIVIHNHPDSNIFTGNDIRSFIRRSNTAGLTAIGNDGRTLFAMFKQADYDEMRVYQLLKDTTLALNETVQRKSMEEYIKAVEKFLDEVGKYGVEVITRRNQ